jgi:uncharacterized protein YuzE
MLVTWDQTANAMYLAMGSEAAPAHRTIQLDSGTLVDLDEYEVIVGVEIINPFRALPTSEILSMHVPVSDREALERYLQGLAGQSAAVSTTNTPPSLVPVRSFGVPIG